MEHNEVIEKMEQRFFDEKVSRYWLEWDLTSCIVAKAFYRAVHKNIPVYFYLGSFFIIFLLLDTGMNTLQLFIIDILNGFLTS